MPGSTSTSTAAVTAPTAASAELTTTFREAMRAVATPVCVVTTLTGGRAHGTTVSAFASLSMDPPMVMIALDARSDLLATLHTGSRFGVNILVASQWEHATAFARKGPDKFDAVPWSAVDGAPRLEGRGGWLACDLAGQVPGGDHTVVLGTVVAARPAAAPPLTYHDRGFGTHVAHVPDGRTA